MDPSPEPTEPNVTSQDVIDFLRAQQTPTPPKEQNQSSDISIQVSPEEAQALNRTTATQVEQQDLPDLDAPPATIEELRDEMGSAGLPQEVSIENYLAQVLRLQPRDTTVTEQEMSVWRHAIIRHEPVELLIPVYVLTEPGSSHVPHARFRAITERERSCVKRLTSRYDAELLRSGQPAAVMSEMHRIASLGELAFQLLEWPGWEPPRLQLSSTQTLTDQEALRELEAAILQAFGSLPSPFVELLQHAHRVFETRMSVLQFRSNQPDFWLPAGHASA